MKSPKTQRARSVKHKGKIYTALLWSSAFYLGVISILSSLTTLFIAPSKIAQIIFGVSVTLSLFLWLFSLLNRKNVLCSLCRSTPLHDTRSVPHTKSYKLPLLNYGTTNVMRCVFTGKFRCQHCGELFDLRKISE